jgi:diguanylate cyclase (GGDEF)-like protein/PAS domain S-box-containing protein
MGPMTVATSENETKRLEALRRPDLLNTAPEPEFDELVNLAAAICDTPISLLTLVGEHRQWSKGFDVRETPLHSAFCTHTLLQPDPFVVEDAATDERFATNPLVTEEPSIRFYAGVPVTSLDGHVVGTLCVMDREPRNLTQIQMNMLAMLARQVNAHMELRLQRKQLEAALQETDRSRGELRASEERFRTFMDNSPFMSFMKDTEGRLVFYNQRFADRFGISPTAWLGKTDFEIWPEDQAQATRQTDIEVLMGGRLQIVDEQLQDKAGTTLRWRTYKFPCVSASGMTLLAGVAVDETEAMAREIALNRTQAELQSANALLKELVVTDALTGLGNRRVLDDRLSAEITAVRRGRKLSLLMLDIDHFKLRNDTFGHQDGDEVLRQMGALLRRLVRGNEVAVRYGGEEMAVLMPGASEDEAAGLARRLLKAIRTTAWAHQPVTVSIGVAECVRSDMRAEDLLTAADVALYAAKGAGRDRFVRRSETA